MSVFELLLFGYVLLFLHDFNDPYCKDILPNQSTLMYIQYYSVEYIIIPLFLIQSNYIKLIRWMNK